MANYKDLNEALKAKEARERAEQTAHADEGMHLDDVSRVKILSPGRQVTKRFMRNRLAIFGLYVLIIMFVFCFIGPLFYPYGQTEVFYKYDTISVDYALASETTSYTGYTVDEGVELERNVVSMMNTNIKAMEAGSLSEMNVSGSDGTLYGLEKLGEGIYTLSRYDAERLCTVGRTVLHVGLIDTITGEMSYSEGVDLGSAFVSAAAAACSGTEGEFEYGGTTYSFERAAGRRYDIYAANEGITYYAEAPGREFESALEAAIDSGDTMFSIDDPDAEPVLPAEGEEDAEGEEPAEPVVPQIEFDLHLDSDGNYSVYQIGEKHTGMVFSTFSPNMYNAGTSVTDEFRVGTLLSAYTTGEFTADGQDYTVEPDGEGGLLVRDSSGGEYADFTTFVIRRYDGKDTMSYALKSDIREVVAEMDENGEMRASVISQVPQQSADGGYQLDEDGNQILNDTELRITRRDTGEYVINCDQITYLIDLYAKPSAEHILGTDGDGFDVLSRVMYGGRISLMVGFVVVFLEIFLGVIMGGLAGYYGKWVDNLIMRLVDIFYCLPSMPIMIILGALMDALRMNTYVRLMLMMAALGIMGWAGIARMVRGQILSLREQEFMVATEATGIRVKDRIFRHLVPNVMPQLIVIATLNIGGVIITESTLSFLGLGVKHPLATWGTIINSVSSASAMSEYPFIWIPVGLLICFTVIAFNFVGDGLRDAYDPKAKR